MSKLKTWSLALGGFIAGALITLQIPAFAQKDATSRLPIDDLRKLCCAVGCSITDVYSADVLRALYGIGRKRRKETERDTATVRISNSTLEAVDEYRESLHVTRKQMVEMAVDYWGAN